MDRIELTKKLKQARQDAGLKQEDLAKCLDIPISAVSILESGNRKLDVLELVKIADLYGKPIEWFFKVHDDTKKRRWYDQNAIVEEAIDVLRQSPTVLQVGLANGIISFLKNYDWKKLRR